MRWATKLSPPQMEVIREEVRELVQKGVMRKVPMAEAKRPGQFNRV